MILANAMRLLKTLAARCTQNAKGMRYSARVLALNLHKCSLNININSVNYGGAA